METTVRRPGYAGGHNKDWTWDTFQYVYEKVAGEHNFHVYIMDEGEGATELTLLHSLLNYTPTREVVQWAPNAGGHFANIDYLQTEPAGIPEPATLGLLVLGGIAAFRRRR